ncbi:hypothetical protein OGAPHI_005460 [Ogataea philodendri]|uniref:Uncharacterized protein n=1 Tax=Ogataea philodendri TaxID=1378263 RepID=A0A9P8NZ80_9ASCO|nr:uncharacterized protein OGAPHI_005460 [Ogataea philodendri]KAH3662212.1 hypothetical protein OGAPHI_005460 [Ogataea philodendri]
MNFDAQSLIQCSSTEERLDDGWRIHLSKQFSVNELTREVAYAVAISVAMDVFTCSLICCACAEPSDEPLLALVLDPPRPRNDDIGV